MDYLPPQIHAPWCTPCKTLEPEYNKLGEALKNIPSIVVARIDATKNEVEGLKVLILLMNYQLATSSNCSVSLGVQ
jgi:thiol-disulfide isomerase/thioredoxin